MAVWEVDLTTYIKAEEKPSVDDIVAYVEDYGMMVSDITIEEDS